MDDVKSERKTTVVNGTTYDAETPPEVIRILEWSRNTKTRLAITFGDVQTGEVWGKPERGHVGRSTGESKIPLLMRTRRSLGGEALSDHRIIRIVESKGGKLLYNAFSPK